MTAAEPGLRIGVATDGPIVAWQAATIEALAAVHGVHLERWIRGSSKRIRSAEAADSPSIAPVEALFPGVASSGPMVAGALDVLLDLTGEGLPSPFELAPEIWHFAYGKHAMRDPHRAALVDYIATPGHSMVGLVSEPSGARLREGRLAWWRGEQLDRILLDPSAWPALVARDRLDPQGQAHPPTRPRPGRKDRTRSIPTLALEVAGLGRRMMSIPGTATRHDDWNIGLIPARIQQFLSEDLLGATSWMPRRPGHFAADPFGTERDGVLHVFFEDYDQAKGRGLIAHCVVGRDGQWSDPEVVIDPGVHASYPFLVEDLGATFLLPETSAAGELVLYEAVDFPTRWRPAATLLTGVPAVDASVVHYEGRWWMFATRADRGPNHNLFIWHAPALTGPWTPHMANPVMTDERSARPGGTPFSAGGQLFRPSQDNSKGYGGGIVLNRVDILNPRVFSERKVRQISPETGSAYPDGLHTLAETGGRTLIDGNVRHLVRATVGLEFARRLGGGRSGERPN